jgi:thiol-disulfide isomerase/thioredoxin
VYPNNLLKLIALLLLFVSCEQKSVEEKRSSSSHDTNPTPSTSQQEPKGFGDTFTLHSLSGEYYSVTVSEKKVTFKEAHQGVVLLWLFNPSCTPCLHQIPYLNDLGHAYAKELLIVGISLYDPLSKEAFKSFSSTHNINYYLAWGKTNNLFGSLVAKSLTLPEAFPIPLTVIYLEGEYYTHYEGIVPIEMIRYDIDQALESLK